MKLSFSLIAPQLGQIGLLALATPTPIVLALLVGGSALSHVHASVNGDGGKEEAFANNLPSRKNNNIANGSKNKFTLNESGGKVYSDGSGFDIDASVVGHSVQRRAKSKGKSKKNGKSKPSGGSNNDDEMVTLPLTIRMENVPENVDLDMLESSVLALVENTAKNVAKCNTDGGEGSVEDMFERKLQEGVLGKLQEGVWQVGVREEWMGDWELNFFFPPNNPTIGMEHIDAFYTDIETFEAELQAQIQFWNTYAASLICNDQGGGTKEECFKMSIVPSCNKFTDESSCGSLPNCWWSAQAGGCNEICYNTKLSCGNQISWDLDTGLCNYYENGYNTFCVRSDCDGNSSNSPNCDKYPALCWWSNSDGVCYQTCYNTNLQCGNEVPRNNDGSCNYESGILCARSDCESDGSNHPNTVETCT